MPYKSEKAKLQGTKYDRRVKLTEKDKEEIRENISHLSQRKLAAKYGVSRRLIQFVMNPEKQEANYQRRLERGGSKIYYDKDKHTETIREHRRYKQRLFEEEKITIKTEESHE